MTKIKIVVDSTADLPQEIYQQYDITVLPMLINFGEDSYRDGLDITTSEFYLKLQEFHGFPTTAQITPGVFMKAYEELAKDADVIISMHISEKLSGTLDSARMAAQEFKQAQVIVYNSESASLGFGFQVLEAARAIAEGCDLQQVIERVEQVKKTVSVYFSVPSLENLQKGGRIGRASALIGGLLNIVPLLTIIDGVVAPFEKLRGKKRVIPRLTELIAEKVQEWGQENTRVAVLHTNNLEGAEAMVNTLTAEFGFDDLMVSEIGPTIGVHTGSGVIATVFYKKIN